jgi:hypothetical protein
LDIDWSCWKLVFVCGPARSCIRKARSHANGLVIRG